MLLNLCCKAKKKQIFIGLSDLRSTFDLFTDLNSHVNCITSKVDEVTALIGLGITSIQKHVRPCIMHLSSLCIIILILQSY